MPEIELTELEAYALTLAAGRQAALLEEAQRLRQESAASEAEARHEGQRALDLVARGRGLAALEGARVLDRDGRRWLAWSEPHPAPSTPAPTGEPSRERADHAVPAA